MAKNAEDRRIIFRCPEELAQRLEEAAERKGLGLSGYIRMLLIEGVERQEMEERDKKRQAKG